MTRPRIAFIGAGAIARYHAAAAKVAGFRLAAIAASPGSIRARAMAEEFGFAGAFDSSEELLASSGWDALLICTAHDQLLRYLESAVSDGRPILVEKPVALSSTEICGLLSHACEHVAVAYNRRHYASTRAAKRFLAANGRGVITVEIPESVNRSSHSYEHQWKNVLTNSVHMLDLAGFIGGGLGRVLHDGLEAPALEEGLVQLRISPNGHLVILKAIWNSPANFSITLEANEERYVLSPIEIGTRYSGMEVIQPTRDVPIRRYVPRVEECIIASAEYASHKPGFVEQMLSFKSLVIGKERDPELATVSEAADVLALAEDLIGY